jgi:hypothetical protein
MSAIVQENESMSVIRLLLSVALFPFLLTLLSAFACYSVAGPSLGLFIGGLVLVTLIVPIVSMAEARILDRLIASAAVVCALVLVWLIATFNSETYIREWIGCSIILASYAILLAALPSGLRLVRCSPVVSAALTVTVGLFWLTWPIWLSRTWNGSDSEAGVARLVLLHPGMTVNAQVAKLGAWSGQSVAYHLTDLQQNVLYALPHNYWPCVLFNLIIGGALLGLASWLTGRGVAVKTCPSIVQTEASATNESAA